jgi:glutamate dehydrogenase (NADP+)
MLTNSTKIKHLLLPACVLPLQGKRCFVSGSGNVAQYAAEKLIQLGAVVLTLSDSTGYIYEKDGFTMEQVHQVRRRA